MRTPRPRWLRLPRRTARLRLTVRYGGAVFLACGATMLAVTYLFYGQLGNAPTLTRPVLHLYKQGKEIPIAAVQPAEATIRMTGLGQLSFDRQQLLIAAGVALAVIAVAATAIGWLIAGQVLRPLRAITAAARRISASNLHERLALHGPDDELKELADTLDSLFARLETSFDAQRRFAASASHELRTPLTRERTLLQVTLADPAATTGTWQAVSQDLLASNAEQEHLIDALLTLASSERGIEQPEPFDLGAIARSVLAARTGAAQRGQLQLAATLDPALVAGDPGLAESLVSNLVDNALRHNVTGGRVQIHTGLAAGQAVISVRNTGPVIPPGEVDRLFQPFQRLSPGRTSQASGHGLGLAIVAAIARAHHATLTARARPAGGLDITVSFPAPPPTPGAPALAAAGHDRGQ